MNQFSIMFLPKSIPFLARSEHSEDQNVQTNRTSMISWMSLKQKTNRTGMISWTSLKQKINHTSMINEASTKRKAIVLV